jgi:hypothetical protein
MKFLIDSDLFLEAILNRPNLFRDARLVWELIESQSDIEAYVVGPGLDKIISVTRSLMLSEEDADEATALILSTVKIAYVDPETLRTARQLPLKNFESAIELVCAEAYNTVAIVTHRPEEFEGLSQSHVPIWSVRNFLEVVNLEKQIFVDDKHLGLNIKSSSELNAGTEDYLVDGDCFDLSQYLNRFPITKNWSTLTNCSLYSRANSNLPGSSMLYWA